eukprot:TRINITY_DN6004_c0_g4_i2.p1 TRINITY_DN6004_c0_g4~~TRINITY_DN6004_c0_g4_i2.p1  ORF type:complete len:189 (-),score=44.34 TRINITY_DN6004_c0_g4_i2:131-697(-)
MNELEELKRLLPSAVTGKRILQVALFGGLVALGTYISIQLGKKKKPKKKLPKLDEAASHSDKRSAEERKTRKYHTNSSEDRSSKVTNFLKKSHHKEFYVEVSESSNHDEISTDLNPRYVRRQRRNRTKQRRYKEDHEGATPERTTPRHDTYRKVEPTPTHGQSSRAAKSSKDDIALNIFDQFVRRDKL